MRMTTQTLRDRNLPILDCLEISQEVGLYASLLGTSQLKAALRVLGLTDRYELTPDQVKRVLAQLAGTALLTERLAKLTS